MFSFLRRRAFASAAGVSATGKQQQALKGDIVSAALQSVSNLDPATAAEAARRKVAVSRQVALPISAIKLRWVANQVRGLPYHAAVAQMQLSARRKAAKIIELGLHSARGNAVNQQGLALDRLFVYRIEVNIGEKLARQKFHSKHRAGRMHRPHAHLRITLAERAPRAEKTTRNNNFTIEQQQ